MVTIVIIVAFIMGGVFGVLVTWEKGGMKTGKDFDKMRPEIEEQMRLERERELIKDHIEGLKEDYEVEKDLRGIYGEGNIKASVDGEYITEEDFEDAKKGVKNQMLRTGMKYEDVESEIEKKKDEILRRLVDRVVLGLKVEDEGIELNENVIEEQMERYIERVGGEKEFKGRLEQVGMSKEEVKDRLREDLDPEEVYIDRYLDGIKEEEFDFSEEEIREFYEDM